MGRFVEVAIRAVKGFTGDKSNIAAAGITYFALLSIFPLLLLALGVFGFFVTDPEDQRQLVDRLINELPLDADSGRDDLEQTITSIASARGALGIFGLLGLLYSGSALFTAIRTALNGVFRAEKARPFVLGKLVDIGLVATFGLLVTLSIGASFAISLAARFSEELVGEDAATLVARLLTLAYFLLPPLISLTVFLLLYAIVPARNVTFKEALPGALAAMLLFETLKVGFTQYVAAFGNYDATYGALGFVIILLMFIYFSSQVMLLGAQVARANAEVKAEWPLEPGESQAELLQEKVRPILGKVGLAGLLPGERPITGTVVDESPSSAATALVPAVCGQAKPVAERPSGTMPVLAAGGALLAAAVVLLARLRRGGAS
jgi:membrane protein